MRLRTIIRTNPGAWLLIPLTLLAVLYARGFVAGKLGDAYAPAVSSAGLAALGFIGPLCAALGAREAGRLRRARWWSAPHVRHPVAIVVQSQAPIIIAGSVALLAGAAVDLLTAGVTAPDPRPLVVGLAVVAAHTLAGAALGRWLPPAVAPPAALLASFAWMVLPRVLEPLWLRHLNGLSLELCCATWTDLAPGAILGSLAVAGGMIVGSLALLSARQFDWMVAAKGGLTLAAGLFVGVLLVAPLGTYPTVPRDQSSLECAGAETEPLVCLWPEHRDQLPVAAAAARRAIASWRAIGLSVPLTVREGSPDIATPGELRIAISSASQPANILEALAYGMLPPWPACAETSPFPGADAADYVRAWLLATAGMPPDELATRFPDPAPVDPALFPDAGGQPAPSVLSIITRVRALAAGRQLTWMTENLAALSTCNRAPEITPRG